MTSALSEKLKAAFARNPLAWFLGALLLITGYGNYEGHHHLAMVCEDIGDMMREPPLNARTMLAAWQRREADEVDDICGTELAEPEPSNP